MRQLKLWKRFRRFWHCLFNLYSRSTEPGIFPPPELYGKEVRVSKTVHLGVHRAVTFHCNDGETFIMCGCGKIF